MNKSNLKKLFLVGNSLSHSFSKGYFEQKFAESQYDSWSYGNFEISSISKIQSLLMDTSLKGFNVTIPYKTEIIPFLDEIDITAQKIGSVNTVVKKENRFIGYNTDMPAFVESLSGFNFEKAMVLGTGGASKAIVFALKHLGKGVLQVGRNTRLTYNDLQEKHIIEHQLVINCTPLGTTPNINEKPNLPYNFINANHILYDLVYNPRETAFMKEGLIRGAKVKNGLQMLELQADMSLDLWKNSK